MISQDRFLGIVGSATVLAAISCNSCVADGAARKPVPRGDFVCGPRCVQYVLRNYGVQSRLVDLVREIQWPAIEDGATLDSLERAFNSRSISTCAITIAPGCQLNWPYPVIVHLKETDGQLGHFVVWLPTSQRSMADVWTGLDGIQRGSAFKLAAKMSGAVLLTANMPITNPHEAVRRATRDPLWFRASTGGLLIALIANAVARWHSVRAGLPSVSHSLPKGASSCVR